MTTEVINIKNKREDWRRKTKRYVYIGRPTIWGNQFTHLRFLQNDSLIIVPTQEDAVKAFRDWLFGSKFLTVDQKRREEILRRLMELEGKYLGCYCAPEPCHGNVYVEMLEHGYMIIVNGVRYAREVTDRTA